MDLDYHLAVAHQRELLSLAQRERGARDNGRLRAAAAALRLRLLPGSPAPQAAPCPTC